jgi:hypothetical protein
LREVTTRHDTRDIVRGNDRHKGHRVAAFAADDDVVQHRKGRRAVRRLPRVDGHRRPSMAAISTHTADLSRRDGACEANAASVQAASALLPAAKQYALFDRLSVLIVNPCCLALAFTVPRRS